MEIAENMDNNLVRHQQYQNPKKERARLAALIPIYITKI
jgi:hypothetical protein